MLLTRRVLEGIANGSISLAFRRWRKPTVKTSGSLKTAIGVLAIDEIAVIDEAVITDKDAAQAGFTSVAALRADLAGRTGGAVYRIRLRYVRDDPRIALRADDRSMAMLGVNSSLGCGASTARVRGQRKRLT